MNTLNRIRKLSDLALSATILEDTLLDRKYGYGISEKVANTAKTELYNINQTIVSLVLKIEQDLHQNYEAWDLIEDLSLMHLFK